MIWGSRGEEAREQLLKALDVDWQSVQSIKRRTGFQQPTVQRYLLTMSVAGAIERKRLKNKLTGRTADHYRRKAE